MLTAFWIGLIGALLMFAGDMLLYYTPKDFSYSVKSSSEEKINAIIDVMKALPAAPITATARTLDSWGMTRTWPR